VITDKWAEALSADAVLITVNQRLARHYVHAYQQWCRQHNSEWWETPQVLPWRAWVTELHSDAMVSGQSDRLLLPDLLQQRLWLQCLSEDEALSPLLDMDAAAQNAQRAWSIAHFWRCASAKGDTLSLDQQAFLRWAMRYQSLCEEQQLIDEATLVDHLCSLLEASQQSLALPSNLLLAGFLRETPQQRRLLDCLRAAGVTVEHIKPERSAICHRRVYVDDDAELLAIATQVRAALTTDAGTSLGVVIAELQQRRAEVLRAFDRVFFPGLNPDQIAHIGRPYDVSLGLPLTEQAVVRTALLLVKLAVAEIAGTEISSLLLSPYVVAANAEARSRERLDRALREQRTRKLTLRGLINDLPEHSGLRHALESAAKLRSPAQASASAWADYFGNLLDKMGWPGESSDSEEFQAIQAWHACLDDLQMLDDGGQLTAVKALSLLRRLARERVFQPETPATPIQIMGRLESHGMTFDQLWVASLDADLWPAAGSPSPFLSIAKQKSAGVPEASVEARLQLAEDEFALWCASVNTIWASHAAARDGNALSPAAVIADIASDEAPELSDSPALEVQQSGEFEQLHDSRGPALATGSVVRGGARLFENQARCPFKAFALHRLHVRPLEEAGMGLDARQHGTLLHVALELFWKKISTHDALMALDDAALDDELQSAITTALSQQTMPDALHDLEQRRLLRLLREWLIECEKPRAPFTVIEFETERAVERGGVAMNLQVDRIDLLDSGHTVVLDYKTGTSNSRKSWSEERIESPQLPLYALTDDAIDGVCFAQVARHKHRFLGVASEDSLLAGVKLVDGEFDDWSRWRAHWQESLDAIAEEIREGVASVTPAKSACDFCDLAALCRVENQTLDEDGSDTTDVADAGATT